MDVQELERRINESATRVIRTPPNLLWHLLLVLIGRIVFAPVTAALILLILGIGIIRYGFLTLYPAEQQTWVQFVADLYANGGAELLSIALTVLIIDTLNQRRSIRERRAELILQMGSPDNSVAVEAVRLLRLKGWLQDGTLRGANLMRANLEGAYLGQADLKGVNLSGANLEGAQLLYTNLDGADLGFANLQRAELNPAYLEGARLSWANLAGASLAGAALDGADLVLTNLEGVYLEDTIFNTETILPDAKYDAESRQFTTNSYWTPDTDMARFTEPDHPDFWRSTDPNSPAYWGGD